MKVTQGDIAKKLNLSIATVSRALRGDLAIHPELRAEVVATAAMLGYHQRAKRTDREEKTGAGSGHRFIGVLMKVPSREDAWAPDEIAHGYLSGMSEISTEKNASLIVHHVSDKSARDLLEPAKQPPMVRDGTISGLIFIHHFPPKLVVEFSKRIPSVTLVHDVPGARINHVDMDHMQAVQDLMDKLFQQGHRRIGFVGYRKNLTWARARLAGYLQAMLRRDLPVEPSVILEEPSGDKVLHLMKKGVTAWVCSIDSIGYRLCRALLDRGVQIPKDASIVGFNGVTPLLNCPQLTTVRPPLKTMGQSALNLLLERLEAPLVRPLKLLHPCEFVPGKTVGKKG